MKSVIWSCLWDVSVTRERGRGFSSGLMMEEESHHHGGGATNSKVAMFRFRSMQPSRICVSKTVNEQFVPCYHTPRGIAQLMYNHEQSGFLSLKTHLNKLKDEYKQQTGTVECSSAWGLFISFVSLFLKPAWPLVHTYPLYHRKKARWPGIPPRRSIRWRDNLQRGVPFFLLTVENDLTFNDFVWCNQTCDNLAADTSNAWEAGFLTGTDYRMCTALIHCCVIAVVH